MRAPKGMVQVNGTTYRLVRVGPGYYEAIRLLDDLRIGSFRSTSAGLTEVQGIDEGIMLAIARAAIHGAKTSWVGRLDLA